MVFLPLLALTSLARAATPAPPAPTKLVSLDLEAADIHTALDFLATAGNVNLVVGDDVKGTVTIRLKHVTWDEAFWAVLSQDHLAAVPVGSTIEIHRD